MEDDLPELKALYEIGHRHDIDIMELKMRVTSAESSVSDLNMAHTHSKEKNDAVIEELKDAVVKTTTNLAILTATINTGVMVLKTSVYLFSTLIVTVIGAGWAIYKNLT